ncbi:DUF4129 domain-containing protein [Thermogladius sp. 4427co]|uniref:DUF4129 domain-containing protein n=1 Tax=Thermogladius sp. 4427co TaxID=3450718 RepID=UPI003F79D5C0
MRHTPGFTGSSTDYILDEIINALRNGNLTAGQAAEAYNILSSLANQTATSTSSPSTGISVNETTRALSEYFYLASGNYSASDLLNAINMINNSAIRDILSKLLTSGNVSRSDIEKASSFINQLLLNGEISQEDYMLALKLLSAIAGYYGYSDLSKELDNKAMNTALELLMSIRDQLSNTGKSLNFSISGNTGFGTAGHPQFILPSLMYIRSSLSRAIGLYLAIFSAALMALILLYYARGVISSKISGYLVSRRLSNIVERARIWGDAVLYYWRSVEEIEKIARIDFSPYETHREFLKKVERRLGNVYNIFSRLTEIYEIRRYAGLKNSELDEEARRLYGELRGKT